MPEKITPIYSGRLEDFVWAGFGSGSGTNLRECAKIIKPVAIFSDRKEPGLRKIPELNAPGIEKLFLSGIEACGRMNEQPEEVYLQRCRDYNARILDVLKKFEKDIGKAIDLIVLGGYMRFVMDPLLSEYKDKIINVHPAALEILILKDPSQPAGGYKRRFVGGNAVYDAIFAGETRTKSSVIMVDSGEDHGEILTQGPWLDVHQGWLKQFGDAADKPEYLKYLVNLCVENIGEDDPKKGRQLLQKGHQNQQKEVSDWPALTEALKMIAAGRLALGTEPAFHGEWRRVYLDGKALPYEGHQVQK
jgi:folate-dependent phosphoribosylglycinamide formyltransferase PurN